MASADDAPVCIVLHSDPWQVLSAADLAALVRSSAQQQGDVVSIVGFGSLLSERSTRLTFPRASDFRVARLPGFRRVFGHVAPVFLRRGLHRVDDAGILRAASLSIERWGGGGEEPLSVTLFEIPGEEMGAFLERVRGAGRIHLSLYVCMYVCVCVGMRHVPVLRDAVQEEEFEILRVGVEDDAGISTSGLACGASTDERYRELRLGESAESIAQHPEGVQGEGGGGEEYKRNEKSAEMHRADLPS